MSVPRSSPGLCSLVFFIALLLASCAADPRTEQLAGAPQALTLGGSVFDPRDPIRPRPRWQWQFHQKVVESRVRTQGFGHQVDLSETTAAVAAFRPWGSGMERRIVHVFKRAGGTLSFDQELSVGSPMSSGDYQSAVALLGDTLAVGAPEEQAVFIYQRVGGVFQEVHRLVPGHDARGFGSTLALSEQRLVVGAPSARAGSAWSVGAVYAFERTAGGFAAPTALPVPSPAENLSFGSALAMRGDTIAVGAPGYQGTARRCGAVFVLTRDGASFVNRAVLTITSQKGTEFGRSVALSTLSGGQVRLVAGGVDLANRGVLQVFEGAPTALARTQSLRGTVPGFGARVLLSGERMVSHAHSLSSEGRGVFVHALVDGTWQPTHSLTESSGHGDLSNAVVAMSGSHLLVGAPNDATTPLESYSGLARLLRFGSEGALEDRQILTPSLHDGTNWSWQIAARAENLAVRGTPHGIDVFERWGAGWSKNTHLAPTTSELATSVAIDGPRLALLTFSEFDPLRPPAMVTTLTRTPSGSLGFEASTPVSLTHADGSAPAEEELYGYVALSGDTLVVALPAWNDYDGRVAVFERTGSHWVERQSFVSDVAASERALHFGHTIALDGDTLAIAEVPTVDTASDHLRQGKVHLYERGEGGFVRVQTLVSPLAGHLDEFGRDLALHGDLLAVMGEGAGYDARMLRLYRRGETGFAPLFRDVISGYADDAPGALSVDGTRLAVGTPRVSVDGITEAGEVRLYQRAADDTWALERTMRAPTPKRHERFGGLVSLEGNSLLVSAQPSDTAGVLYSFERVFTDAILFP